MTVTASTSYSSPASSAHNISVVNSNQLSPADHAAVGASTSHDTGAVSLPSFSVTKWGNTDLLPKFSTRVQELLNGGRIIEEWDTFVAECAYHILANGDMTDKTQYCDFGRAMVQCYPCIASTDGQQSWVSAAFTVSCGIIHSFWLLVT